MPTATGRIVDVKEYAKNTAVKLDDGQFYGGFNNKFSSQAVSLLKTGNVISFEYKQNGKFNNIDESSVQSADASPSAPQQGGGKPSPHAGFSQDTRQLSIHYQSSRNAAIEFVNMAVGAGAVALPSKKGDQYDALLALVKEVTVQFHTDLEQVIEDGGVTPDVPFPSADGE